MRIEKSFVRRGRKWSHQRKRVSGKWKFTIRKACSGTYHRTRKTRAKSPEIMRKITFGSGPSAWEKDLGQEKGGGGGNQKYEIRKLCSVWKGPEGGYENKAVGRGFC